MGHLQWQQKTAAEFELGLNWRFISKMMVSRVCMNDVLLIASHCYNYSLCSVL